MINDGIFRMNSIDVLIWVLSTDYMIHPSLIKSFYPSTHFWLFYFNLFFFIFPGVNIFFPFTDCVHIIPSLYQTVFDVIFIILSKQDSVRIIHGRFTLMTIFTIVLTSRVITYYYRSNDMRHNVDIKWKTNVNYLLELFGIF